VSACSIQAGIAWWHAAEGLLALSVAHATVVGKDDSQVRRRLEVYGRDADDVRSNAFAGTPAECIKTLERAVEAGARRFWISIHFDDKLRFMRDWAEQVMPAFR